MIHFKEADWDSVLSKVDINKDGHVSLTEFMTATYDKQKLLTEDNMKRAFEVFDQDGNGRVSK